MAVGVKWAGPGFRVFLSDALGGRLVESVDYLLSYQSVMYNFG